MLRLLITAFEPYDCWKENASWLALVEFTKTMSSRADITTRLYPVDFAEVKTRLERDLRDEYDVAIHLGQSPGASCIELEAIGLNVGGRSDQLAEQYEPLIEDGPVAYRSTLPLAEWSQALRSQGIPTNVSYHAGAYLCNATLFLTHYFAEKLGLNTQAAFVHLPLNYSQTVEHNKRMPAMPSAMSARAVQLIVEELVKRAPAHEQELA
ncbi:MAG: pyrrolidone-carboxylate peptidase [Planctomycetaceae bacterium]|nr:pyrrolidone-carboxylate peptidase [Planctomycetaceae bacterium]